MTAVETWRPVVDLEGIFEVSDWGQLRSVDRLVVRSNGRSFQLRGRVLKLFPDVSGYLGTTVRVDGQPIRLCAHVEVAAAFIGPRPEGLVVRHLDGDPQRNDLQNLAYGTPSESIMGIIRRGNHRHFSAVRCKWGHLLAGANVTPLSQTRPRTRMCLSCNRATSALRPQGKTRKSPEFLPLADQFYSELTAA
jgi:hypothetical protein